MGSRLFALAAIMGALALYHSGPSGATSATKIGAAVSVSMSPFDPRRLSLADFADAEPE